MIAMRRQAWSAIRFDCGASLPGGPASCCDLYNGIVILKGQVVHAIDTLDPRLALCTGATGREWLDLCLARVVCASVIVVPYLELPCRELICVRGALIGAGALCAGVTAMAPNFLANMRCCCSTSTDEEDLTVRPSGGLDGVKRLVRCPAMGQKWNKV